jgi:hypothetical protein
MSADQRPLLYLYTLDLNPASYSFSPFAIKLRLRLRHGGVRYEDRTGSFPRAPKGKIPYVEFLPHHEDGGGELMGDSGLVTERLVREGRLQDWNGKVGPEERVRDLCLRSLLEDRMYFLMVSFCDEWWAGKYEGTNGNSARRA